MNEAIPGVRFTGPFLLRPLWHLYGWWITRWITHDCDKQPVTCRLPSSLWIGWIDREQWTEEVDDQD